LGEIILKDYRKKSLPWIWLVLSGLLPGRAGREGEVGCWNVSAYWFVEEIRAVCRGGELCGAGGDR